MQGIILLSQHDCSRRDIEFKMDKTFCSLGVYGSEPPSELERSRTEYLRQGKAVGVHCRAGIGRSSMIAACALIRTGLSVELAFRMIEKARGCSVPDTPEQREWVERYSTRLGRSDG